MKREPYTYMILRYRHDPVAGEQINVGVVLHAAESGFLGAAIRKAYGRVSKLFPTVDGTTLRRDLAGVERAFKKLAKTNVRNDLVSRPNVATFALQVVGRDDSALIWSDVGSGVTSDPAKTLEDLHTRFVAQYDTDAAVRRSDADIWKPFRDLLVERQVADILQHKTIKAAHDEVDFDHAWKNGKWHCFQPLSFDLLTPDGIQEKAARWVGHMVGLKSASEEFQPYFIIGEPTEGTLRPAYDRAIEFIGSAPLSPRIITEKAFDTFADELADEINAHRAQAGVNG